MPSAPPSSSKPSPVESANCASVQQPYMPKPSFDWAGKSLQFIQSILLILTFSIAFAERQRTRKADRFGETVVKFAADLSDKLYQNTQRLLDEFGRARGTGPLLLDLLEQRQKLVADFSRELFHTHNLIELRVKLFPHCDLSRLTALYEEMEDNFTLAVSRLPIDDRHPELLTLHVADASSKVLNYLLEREDHLERGGGFVDRIIRACKELDKEIKESI